MRRGDGTTLSVGLEFESGPTFWLKPIHFGSNPYYVAELILHYLDHPDRRELLRDPDAAIREVMEIAEAEEPRERTDEQSEQP